MGVPAASAKVILAKAAAVIAGSDGAILHADISATQTWRNGHSDNWTEQDWQQVGSPYDDRSIDIGVWPTTVEMAYVKGQQWLYDPSTNTIYTNDPPPAFTLTAASQPGTYTLRPGSGSSGPSLTVTASQAAALRSGADVQVGDVISTGPTTGAILDYAIGGRVQLFPGTTVEVTGERRVTARGPYTIDNFTCDLGRIWVGITTNAPRFENEIGTNGGVIGIHG